MDDGGKGGEVNGQGHTGDGGDSAAKGLEELVLADVQDIRGESVALVVDLGNSKTVGEGRDVEHVQQGGLRGTDLATRLDELEVGGNFNGTTGNLGRDTEGLEERGLAGLHTGVASGDPDIGRSDSTSTGRSSNLVGQNLVTDGFEVAVSEDETDVALDVGQDLLVLGGIGDEGLEGSANLDTQMAELAGYCFTSNCAKAAQARTMVFLPIRTTASLRSDCRTSCICWELTLSTVTMKMDLYSSSRALSLGKYSAFFSLLAPMSSYF